MGPFKTMEWIRQVRDQHYELLKGKTTEERIAFYREGARRLLERLKPELETKKSTLNLNQPSSEGRWQFCHSQSTFADQEKAKTTMLKKLRIYVDTSVIGGCFDPEFATWSNGLFKDFEKGIYQPVLRNRGL
jgi:hypothetical protein